mgnify:CR=1 FL=1
MELLPRKRFLESMAFAKLYNQTLPDKNTSNTALYELYLTSNIWVAFLNSAASEQSSRMNAMENASKNAKEIYAKILNYFIIVGALVFVGIVVFIDVLKRPFINEAYWDAIIIVPIVLLANLFLGVYHNLAIWYKLTDKTRFAMLFSIIGAIITIIVNVVMIPKVGFIASAWATLMAYGIMMLLSYFIGKKHYPVPYNIKKTISYLGTATLISFVSFKFFLKKAKALLLLSFFVFFKVPAIGFVLIKLFFLFIKFSGEQLIIE